MEGQALNAPVRWLRKGGCRERLGGEFLSRLATRPKTRAQNAKQLMPYLVVPQLDRVSVTVLDGGRDPREWLGSRLSGLPPRH